MQVSRNKDGSYEVYNGYAFFGTSRGKWVQFTPLQPMLDAMRLLDCVPKLTRIPGVGIRWSVHCKGCNYELED
jgi:hypothetical protein